MEIRNYENKESYKTRDGKTVIAHKFNMNYAVDRIQCQAIINKLSTILNYDFRVDVHYYNAGWIGATNQNKTTIRNLDNYYEDIDSAELIDEFILYETK
jgi:hypothetical protein